MSAEALIKQIAVQYGYDVATLFLDRFEPFVCWIWELHEESDGVVVGQGFVYRAVGIGFITDRSSLTQAVWVDLLQEGEGFCATGLFWR
ncbi:MAG: hypothetical protein AAFU66_10970 [Pseudomonadota bacterium]